MASRDNQADLTKKERKMKYEINFPDLGCRCVKTHNSRSEEYSFHIYSHDRREVIKVPPNVNGIPVTEVFFERDYFTYRNMPEPALKKVFITKRIRKIEKSDDCYQYMIPEIIVDENNPYFRVHNGVLYRGRRLLFATNICKDTYEVLPSTSEICERAFSSLSKVVLPASVRKVGYRALSGCNQIEVFDNISAKVRYANSYGFELAVRSSESGELIYKLFFPKYEYFDYNITENRNAVNLNFTYYDNYFNNIQSEVDFDEKIRVCLDRLMYPYRLSKAAEARYKKFISDNSTHAVKTVIDADDREKLYFLLKLGAVVPENLEELTEYCVHRGKTEFTALLLAHKGKHFPDLPPVFSLE